MNAARNHIRPIRSLIQQEHRALGRRIRGIDVLFATAIESSELPAAVAEVERRLTELRANLECHFNREEAEGFLEEAAAAMPRLAAETTRIKQEHASLLVDLDGLLRSCDSSVEAWERTGNAYRAFAKRILQHEAAENRILQAGYNEDFDVDA